jgi:CBS domain-containing protein
MSIGTMIRRKAITVCPGDSLAKAAKLMEDEGVGAVVVTERSKPVGILTDRDLALATCVRGISPYNVVKTMMTSPVSTIRADEGVLDVTNLMMEQCVRRLPIVDDDGCLVGLVSADDLIPLLSHELSNIAEGIEGTLVDSRSDI